MPRAGYPMPVIISWRIKLVQSFAEASHVTPVSAAQLDLQLDQQQEQEQVPTVLVVW